MANQAATNLMARRTPLAVRIMTDRTLSSQTTGEAGGGVRGDHAQ